MFPLHPQKIQNPKFIPKPKPETLKIYFKIQNPKFTPEPKPETYKSNLQLHVKQRRSAPTSGTSLAPLGNPRGSRRRTILGVRIRGTLGDIDPLNEVPFN